MLFLLSPAGASATTPLAEPPREVRFTLGAPDSGEVDWMLGFRDASIERPGPFRLYEGSRWGAWTTRPWLELSWGVPEPTVPAEPTFLAEPRVPASIASDPFRLNDQGDHELVLPAAEELFRDRSLLDRRNPSAVFDFTGPSLATDGMASLFVLPPTKPVVDWRCRRRPVTIVRYGGESEKLELVRCDGSMGPGALDALSILARPPEIPKPEDGLPDEPDAEAWAKGHEWMNGIRVVHPRLVWALQRIADAFPGKAIYVYSGYRPLAEVNDGSGHKSTHGEGRALDIAILRVPNEKLFEVCRELKDVACGFYPNSKFVHVGVRRAHTGKTFWIDESMPGEPARYVDSWPGVIEKGAMAWRAPAVEPDKTQR